ncbi:hypothetical protein PoB_005724500 [Plakobranchus ocellatus]|uniref:Uncharacterized protein n=1 Tax=Plakobranchus ocellatus TaxID=259542 RepID=A0AAV4CG84_9GAST|nr:hypothetical protein PoB_005724500 [Plakobranchus ocellatus]
MERKGKTLRHMDRDIDEKTKEDGRRNQTQKSADRRRFCPQQGDLRFLGPPSGQGAGGGAGTRDRRVPADLRAFSLATMPPTPNDVWKAYITD